MSREAAADRQGGDPFDRFDRNSSPEFLRDNSDGLDKDRMAWVARP